MQPKQQQHQNNKQNKIKMGIRNLNMFLKTNCKKAINRTSLKNLSGKKIAVDISIYMYKYESEDCLIENIYLMISIFRQYNIIPIFVFDGKSPTEKKELLQKRREDKIDAEIEYYKLDQLIKNLPPNNNILEDTKDICALMDALKKKCVYMNRDKIKAVKELIIAYGCTYYDATGEADEVCAMLVIKNIVWACLSEDMDMFVYGCPRVLRYFSLVNHNVVVYDTAACLEILKMTQKEFREVAVISGTDYNATTNNLYNMIKMFNTFRTSSNNNTANFYQWLHENKYENNIELLQNICNKFNLDDLTGEYEQIEQLHIINGPILNDLLRPILIEDGFIL